MIVIILKGDTLTKKTMTWLRNTSSFANMLMEYQRRSLAPYMPGLRNFHGTYFWRCSRAFVEQYPEGVAQDANQDDALS
ncbi:hypothetical protein FPOA_11969 [Fusarium poae]|uniref:Uncharacterized protein n=1 Tax=Fusarium poae TaxID=36050 RepID=A0A1B8AAR2_FUSPO|nr:hypothetical protein FPOA_11969 [Fusarium poae]